MTRKINPYSPFSFIWNMTLWVQNWQWFSVRLGRVRHVDLKQSFPDGFWAAHNFLAFTNTWRKQLNGERLILAQWQKFCCIAAWIIVLGPVVKERISVHGSRKKRWGNGHLLPLFCSTWAQAVGRCWSYLGHHLNLPSMENPPRNTHCTQTFCQVFPNTIKWLLCFTFLSFRLL